MWRICNPSLKRLMYEKVLRLYFYYFLSNIIQVSLQEINILPSFCSDHSLNLFAYNKSFQVALGRKFHNSLVQDETYILKMKENMKHDNASLNSNFKNNKHSEWEL